MSHLDSDTIALIALGEYVDSSHLAQCSKCQSELDELRAVVGTARSLTDDHRPVAPPESVWAGIESAIATPTPLAKQEAQAAASTPRRGAGWYALAASVGVIIGGLGTFVVMNTSTTSQEQSVNIIAQASLEPLGDVEQPAQAAIQQVDGKDVLVVQASGLPTTDGYYEVWLLAPDASSMISVGMLDATEGGTFPLPAGIDLNSFPVVDISLEHYDGDVTHSADSVLRGSLDLGEV